MTHVRHVDSGWAGAQVLVDRLADGVRVVLYEEGELLQVVGAVVDRVGSAGSEACAEPLDGLGSG